MERKTFVVNDIFESIKNVVGIKLKWRKLSSYVEDESFSLPPQYAVTWGHGHIVIYSMHRIMWNITSHSKNSPCIKIKLQKFSI